jgi:MoaA/NifB/PqqE/SkfB family radical SAM enzyme
VAITNACELKCPFCYAPKSPARLSTEEVLTWAQELDANGCLGVGFGGGEPTAHPDIVSLCHAVATNTRLAVTMTTHGHRFNRVLAEELRGSLHFIRVSVDGIGATYEQLRGRPFDELERSLERVATVAPFGLNVVVNAETISGLDSLADFAVSVGASELLLLPEQKVGERPGIDHRTEYALTRWIVERRTALPLTISEARVPDGVPVTDPFVGEAPLEGHAHVDAFGRVRPNAFTSQAVEIEGSLLEALTKLQNEMEKRDESLEKLRL